VFVFFFRGAVWWWVGKETGGGSLRRLCRGGWSKVFQDGRGWVGWWTWTSTTGLFVRGVNNDAERGLGTYGRLV